jgi:glycosyltransferase involved in cell wall biosynthesis
MRRETAVVPAGADATDAPGDPALVSVVVPTRNSETHLAQCLDALATQTYPRIELIVVDNDSADRTREIAARFTDKVFTKGPERSAQLNFGFGVAAGKYVYYTGSDLWSDRDLVEQAVQKCEAEGFDAVYMNVVTDVPDPNLWQRARALERRCYYKEPGMSAARFYRKDVVEALGGLDESLSGVSDDLEFQHRLDIAGYRTAFIDADEHNLAEYDSLKIVVARSLYYGSRIRGYMNKYPDRTKRQYRLVRTEFVKNKHLLLRDKPLFVAFVVYKAVQYAAAATGMVIVRVPRGAGQIQNAIYRWNYGRSGVGPS